MSKLMLVVTLHDSLHEPVPTDADEFQARVLQGAVHGWFEGHIEGEASSGHAATMPTPAGDDSTDMPSPPFPDPGSDELRGILRETAERFTREQLPAAVAFAIGLAWAAGWREGRVCPGCTPRATTDVVLAATVRADRGVVELRAGHGARLVSVEP